MLEIKTPKFMVNIDGFIVINTKYYSLNKSQAILLAFDAILGHKSAHSLATGPVIALPKIKKNQNYQMLKKKKKCINIYLSFRLYCLL